MCGFLLEVAEDQLMICGARTSFSRMVHVIVEKPRKWRGSQGTRTFVQRSIGSPLGE